MWSLAVGAFVTAWLARKENRRQRERDGSFDGLDMRTQSVVLAVNATVLATVYKDLSEWIVMKKLTELMTLT
jgi:hypothetical protein